MTRRIQLNAIHQFVADRRAGRGGEPHPHRARRAPRRRLRVGDLRVELDPACATWACTTDRVRPFVQGATRRPARVPDGDRFAGRRQLLRPARAARREPPQPHAAAILRRLGADRRVRRRVGPAAVARARERGAARHRGVALQRDGPDRGRLPARRRSCRSSSTRSSSRAQRRSGAPRTARDRRGAARKWLFVGRITANKAQHDVVKAFADVPDVTSTRAPGCTSSAAASTAPTDGHVCAATAKRSASADCGRAHRRGEPPKPRRVLRRRRRLRRRAASTKASACR